MNLTYAKVSTSTRNVCPSTHGLLCFSLPFLHWLGIYLGSQSKPASVVVATESTVKFPARSAAETPAASVNIWTMLWINVSPFAVTIRNNLEEARFEFNPRINFNVIKGFQRLLKWLICLSLAHRGFRGGPQCIRPEHIHHRRHLRKLPGRRTGP